MRRIQGQAPTGVVLPPRPNLGPEPLPSFHQTEHPALVWLAFALLALAAIATWIMLRRARATTAAPETLDETEIPLTAESHPDGSLVLAADAARLLLTNRLGRDCMARTTEELTASSEIHRILSPATRSRLLALLLAADRAKFAPTAESGETDQGCDALLATLLSELSASDRGSSSATITGK